MSLGNDCGLMQIGYTRWITMRNQNGLLELFKREICRKTPEAVYFLMGNMIYQKLGVSTSYVGTFIRWAVGMENNESNIQL